MVKIFNDKKHVFWQAFFLTVLFFFIGIVLGVYIEQSRADSLNVAFYNSEASLYDSFALGRLVEGASASCEDFKSASVVFADQIYEEVRSLEKFDDSNKLTESVKIIHRKYDLLRTILWMNIMAAKERCSSEINTVVYLYIYDTENVEIKSEQVVWSRILGDLKEQKGNDIILIPIAVDQEIVSLEYLIDDYNIQEFPSIIINEEHVISEISGADDLIQYFD